MNWRLHWRYLLCTFSFHSWEPYLFPWLMKCTFCGAGKKTRN